MAADNVPKFDDLEPVQAGTDNDDDPETIKLDPGESVVGEIREIRRNLGAHDSTLLVLSRGVGDTVQMWSNGQINRVLDSHDMGPGDVIGIAKTEETGSFTTDDGETVEFHKFDVRALR